MTPINQAIHRFLQGARAGAARAAGVNTHMLDLATGRSLFRNNSHGDDTARQLQQLPGPHHQEETPTRR